MIGANVDRAVTCLVFDVQVDQSLAFDRTSNMHDVSSHQPPEVRY